MKKMFFLLASIISRNQYWYSQLIFFSYKTLSVCLTLSNYAVLHGSILLHLGKQLINKRIVHTNCFTSKYPMNKQLCRIYKTKWKQKQYLTFGESKHYDFIDIW